MKKLFIILFLSPLFINAQLVSLIVRGDTLFSVDPTTGTERQLTKLVPVQTGQNGNVLSTNGTAYQWYNVSSALSAKLNTSDSASMLSPYIRSAVATATYQPIGSYLTSITSGNVTTALGYTPVNPTAISNINNTSDANKPVSTAQQTALDAKQATLVSGTNIKTINGASLLGSSDIAISGASTTTFLNLASNFSSTIVTEAAVTGWTFAVTSGKQYRIEIIASYQTAATTTGGELGFFLTASGAGTIRGFAEADIVSTAAATGLKQPITAIGAADAAGSNLISTGVTAINSPHSFYAVVKFICTVSGTFNVGWATEVNASAAQLNSGSSLIYQILN